MISSIEKNEILNKILLSKTFSKASTTKVLLKYLVESTLQEKEINAYTIGTELFGKKYDPEKSDVNIRVNISHLRKRLKSYYEQEGEDDSLILSIEPGQYLVSFNIREKESAGKKRRGVIGISAIMVVVLAVLYVFIFKSENENVWEPIFINDYETTLYLGDVFGYSGPSAFSSRGWHRDAFINSETEFYAEINKDPEKYKDLNPGEYSYVVFENSYIIKPFTRYFTQNDYDFSIRPTSDFKTRAIKDGNTIYAGPFYVQSEFNELFNSFSKNVGLQKRENDIIQYDLVFEDDNQQAQSVNLNASSKLGEYALVSAFNGPNNSRHYLFFSNHGMGLTAISDYFTNKDSLHAFSDRNLIDSNEFIALYFVKGKDRTDLSMELKYFDNNN